MNIREDTRKMLKECGWTHDQLAQAIGMDRSVLTRYLGLENKKGTIAERLLPFVYGHKRPKKNPDQSD